MQALPPIIGNYLAPKKEPSRSYEARMAPAIAAWGEYDKFLSIKIRIEEITKEWRQFIDEFNGQVTERITNGFWTKIETYIRYQETREQNIKEILKTVAIFDQVINDCPPQKMDEKTLQAEEDLGIDTSETKKRYEKLIEDLNTLRVQRNKLLQLSKDLPDALTVLRLVGETMAKMHCKFYNWKVAYPPMVRIPPTNTPYFMAAVDERKIDLLAQAKKGAAPIEEKREDAPISPSKPPHPAYKAPSPRTYATPTTGTLIDTYRQVD
jgi:hypothetical protein